MWTNRDSLEIVRYGMVVTKRCEVEYVCHYVCVCVYAFYVTLDGMMQWYRLHASNCSPNRPHMFYIWLYSIDADDDDRNGIETYISTA